MMIAGCLVLGRVDDRIVGIHDDHEAVGIGVEVEVPHDRRQHLLDGRPAARAQRGLHGRERPAEHVADQHVQRRLVGRGFAEDGELHGTATTKHTKHTKEKPTPRTVILSRAKDPV